MKKRLCLFSLSFLVLSSIALSAADLVVPAIKAPYSITNAQFDNSGDYFAYEVNGKVFIRDSVSLVLKDSFTRNSGSDISAFYNTPGRVDYPKTKAIPNGNSVIIQTQKSAGSGIESSTVANLPAKVKSATVNKAKTHIAFLGDDGNAYIYEINNNTQLMKTPYNQSSSGINFTKDNKVIFSDSSRTAGLYNLNGQKTKTYTTANSIKGLNLSTDEETLIVYDTNGVLNVYNANTATQIGYVPNFGSKSIKNVELSKDSRRLLVTGENNTLYIATTQDTLYAQNTVAPTPKQFSINYNAFDPNDRNNTGITEYGITEYRSTIDDTDAEYILSAQEKYLGKQNFDLDKEHKSGEAIVITNQPDQAYFPPSLTEKEREYNFSERNGLGENQVTITEYKQPQDYQAPYVVQDYEWNKKDTKITQVQPAVPVTTTGITPTLNGQPVGGNVTIVLNGGTSVPTNGAGTVATTGIATNATSSTTSTTTTSTTTTLTKQEIKAQEKAEKEARKEAEKKAKEEAKKAKAEDEKSPFEKIKDFFEREDIKTYYKDGHGFVANLGVGTTKFPYQFDFSFITGYLNYDLIQPFYLGGLTTFGLETPSVNYPYKYQNAAGIIKNPYLTNVFITAPIGFSIYPWKNSVEFYVEIDPGVTLYKLWNGGFGENSISGQMFPVFCTEVKLGVAWDFINLSLCGSYDILRGIYFGVNLGALINIGGSRTIGSIKQETNE